MTIIPAQPMTGGAWPAALMMWLGVMGLLSGADMPVSGGRLPTRWDAQVSASAPLPEYPRPIMQRAATGWLSLNGVWDLGLTDVAAAEPPMSYAEHIRVPFPYESALSGVNHPSVPTKRLWYRRTVSIPPTWHGQRVLLHIGAVTWDSTIHVNGKAVGSHRGGYDPIDIDITESLMPGTNNLVVSAWNPLTVDQPDAQALGKQRLHPGGIFYTGATGIWQSVWLESVPAVHISGIGITPDLAGKALHVMVHVTGSAAAATGIPVTVVVCDGVADMAAEIATVSGMTGTVIDLPILAPHMWSPEDPHLYGLTVSLAGTGADSVHSYSALRSMTLGSDELGRTTILLNGKACLQVGALDQGYWPDGIYTAPTDEALKYDIELAKKLGFNLLRKHAKVESDRWYYWADTLGMLVWQDMPQGYGDLNPRAQEQWTGEWSRIITALTNHPSIVVWTTFNEGWGEKTFDVAAVVALTKKLDPTRLVNNASGWVDKQVGDIADTHAYPGPWAGKPEANRASVNGEFGGITMAVPGHCWTTEVMGYGRTLTDGWSVTSKYQKLLMTAAKLRKDVGICAFVYTQLTDVEQEINGLVTYDRAIIKPQESMIIAANDGHFPAMPPNPTPPDLVPTAADVPVAWRYTSDKPADAWFSVAFDDAIWRTAPAPFGHGMGGVRTQWTTSDIWIRRTVTLPAAIPDKLDILLKHDEDAEIYVNGVLAATASGYNDTYASIPMSDAARASVRPGVMVIAAHCRNTVGGQGIDIGITRHLQNGPP